MPVRFLTVIIVIAVRQPKGNVNSSQEREDQRLDRTGKQSQEVERHLQGNARQVGRNTLGSREQIHQDVAQDHHRGDQGVLAENITEQAQAEADRFDQLTQYVQRKQQKRKAPVHPCLGRTGQMVQVAADSIQPQGVELHVEERHQAQRESRGREARSGRVAQGNQAEEIVDSDEDEHRAQERRVASCRRTDNRLEQTIQPADEHLDGHLQPSRIAGRQVLARPDKDQ